MVKELLGFLSITSKARQWLAGLALLLGLCAALFGAGWYKGSQSATNAATALKTAELAQAAKDYQEREIENRKHVDKARAFLNDQKITNQPRVRADRDRLRDLIANSADKTTIESCARDADSGGTISSGNSASTIKVIDRIASDATAEAIAVLTDIANRCVTTLTTNADTLNKAER